MQPTSTPKSPWFCALLAALLLMAACSEAEAPFASDNSAATKCVVDEDGDGYGMGCSFGSDCDDEDPNIDTECRVCAKPHEGCACQPGTEPADCFTQELSDHDTLICTNGSRFCRDGKWSICEGANVFEVPISQARSGTLDRAIVGDAGTLPCSPCRPGCFPVTDPLAPQGGPLNGSNSSSAVYAPGGGITLSVGVVADPQVIDTSMPCTQTGALPDADCDGIPDTVDAVAGPNSAGTTGGTIFMDLVPGESENASIVLPFALRSADVYFLLDGSESMAGVSGALAAAITSGSYLDAGISCADTDGDGTPNDELKTQGIAGNIRCILPGSELGAGWVREIPLLGPDANGVRYGDNDEHLFEQRVDIGGSASALSTAVGGFALNANHGGGNAQIQGLHLLATGQESYVGWDRPAVPERACPASSFGYPCFRISALPVVVMLTAEPMHNGPGTTTGDLGAGIPNDYPSSIHELALHAGTYPHYLPVGSNNEAYASAYNTAGQLIEGVALSSIANDFVTFTGNTESMSGDIAGAQLGCPGLAAVGPDAVFRFNVSQRQTIRLSTEGTRFDSVLGIVRADSPITSGTPTDRSFDFRTPAAAGDVTPNALGSLPVGVSARVLGNSAGASADFPREMLGCYQQAQFSAPTDSTDYAPDVAFRFNVDADMELSFQVPADASVKSLSLFQGQPNLGDMDLVVPANAEQVTVGPDVSQNALRLISGYTGTGVTRTGLNLSTAGRTADVPGAAFAAVGCDPGGSAEAAPDTVVNFSLSQPTRVRIETSGDGAGMGAGFEHMIGLSRRLVSAIDHQVPGTANETLDTAYDISENDFVGGGWARVRGSVWNATTSSLMNADYAQAQVGGPSGCGLRGGGADASPDAVFSFTLDQERTLEFDTANTSYRTYLSLHEAPDLVSDNLNDTQATAQGLGTLNGRALSVRGNTQAASINKDYSPIEFDATEVAGVRDPPRSLACNANSRDAVFSFTLTATTDVQVDTLGSAYDTLLGVYDGRGPEYYEINGNSYEYPGALRCNDDYPSTPGAITSRIVLNNLGAGTYYVTVAGWDTSAGSYNLNLTDLRAPPSNSMPLIACDSGSLPPDGERSRMVQTLAAGRYYLVLKGDATQVSPDYDYELNIREVVAPNPMIACGYRNGGDPGIERSVIEEALPAGDYSVVVRGAQAADVGSYRLLIRDVGFSPVEIGCHDSKVGDATSFTRALNALDGNGVPIDYWLVLRGYDANAATPGNDPYSVYIRDANLGIPLDACSQSADGDFTGTLDPGDYYAVVKGRRATDRGWYQLSMGDSDLASASSYADLASYPEARDALTTNGVRVIGAQLGNDASLTEQLTTLASETQTLNASNAPLVVQASATDPQLASVLGTKIVGAIQELSAALSMNVGVRLDPAPSNPPTPFGFSYQAIDSASDGCAAPVNQVHQDCGPGATPEFSVTFTNPVAPDSVPPNPGDPNGGYYMTIELVGDGRYVLERIPVYIIPSEVTPDRPRTTYATEGSYWQDLGSPNCLGTERPTWNSLSWDAALPGGSTITWRMCAAETKAALGGCAMRTLATVTAGGACAQDVDCPDGFCAGSVCQYAIGPTCATDDECGINGLCRDGGCRWTALPIDPAPALTEQEGLRYLRVRVDMVSSVDRSQAPVIYDWSVNYQCQASE